MSEVLDRIKKVTAEVLKIDVSTVGEESRFVEDLGAESVQSIELIAAFEEEFEIELEEEDALAVKTVVDAARHIQKVIDEE